LEINFKKSLFLRKVIDYLGYSVSNKGIWPNDSHIEVINNYPVPNNTKQLHSCLGMFSYFRRFVPSCASIARPLVELLKKGGPFPMNEEQMKVFKDLRNRLSTPPILSIFNPNRETELHTDSSFRVFGAVFMQKQNDGKMRPVLYYLLKALEAESRYYSSSSRHLRLFMLFVVLEYI